MAARSPTQPTHSLEIYRQRLNDEMKAQGLTDRDMADRLTAAGFPLAHTGVYRTRTGVRQPTLDECLHVAHVLNFDNLESFLAGPHLVRITRATHALTNLITFGGPAYRNQVQEALLDVSRAFEDDEARAALDEANPNWRVEYFRGIEHDLRWAMRDQVMLWGETLKRLAEIFGVDIPRRESGALLDEMKAGQ